MSEAIHSETLRDGGVERIVLARPPANIVDMAAVAAVRAHLARLSERPSLRLILFDSEGDHFSYGASVAEHLPEVVGAMLPGFHRLFVELEALGIPTAAVVRGQCLGGGAELATWCGTVYCSPSAVFSVPEVRLAVFPPIAAMALPWRVGGAVATRLVTSAQRVRGPQAAAIGLADLCVDDPGAALLSWYDEALAPLSPAGLRVAWRAVRRPMARALAEELPALERLYLDELMAHPDATEGLRAFLDKRPPAWRHP